MAENKQYIIQNQENGTVMISVDVLAAIVVSAVKDVEGVVGLTVKLGTDMISIKNWSKGLKISIGENNAVSIDCNIVVAYGQPIIVVAQNAQEAISTAIENMTGVKPSVVNVNVCGIARQ